MLQIYHMLATRHTKKRQYIFQKAIRVDNFQYLICNALKLLVIYAAHVDFNLFLHKNKRPRRLCDRMPNLTSSRPNISACTACNIHYTVIIFVVSFQVKCNTAKISSSANTNGRLRNGRSEERKRDEETKIDRSKARMEWRIAEKQNEIDKNTPKKKIK